MGYLDSKKKSKKKDTKHVAMSAADGRPKTNPASMNRFAAPKNTAGRRSGDR